MTFEGRLLKYIFLLQEIQTYFPVNVRLVLTAKA
jgi:hypothetical protein